MRTDLCPNCFEAGYQNGSCSRCGYQSSYGLRSGGMSLPEGTVLKNRYYLGRLLGEGGFGITYKAYDLQRGSVCAVKEYVPNGVCRRGADQHGLELISSEYERPYLAGMRRFLEESQILSRLEQIPSVVDITDTCQENNTAYFVMEYLDGADLRQIVRASRQRLSPERVTDIILQVAVSMDVIHTKTRIIHRDISPENIYITKDGKVKLIDFGSAKQTQSEFQTGLSVVLKPKVAPPEQFSSQMAQGSFTDVYALAGTYYFALTGNYIPSAPDRLSGLRYVPLKELNIGISPGVSDAVDRALLLDVKQRTRTMQDFIQDIAAGGGIRGAAQSGQGQRSQLNRQPQSGMMPQPNRQMQPGMASQPNRQAQSGMVPKPSRQAQAGVAPQPSRQSQPGAAYQPNRQPQRRPQPAPYVQVVSGPENGKQWRISPNQTMTFGRSATEASLRIRQPEDVSRVHCQITYVASAGKFCIRDLSANGVYYKGTRLKKGVDYQVKPPARFMLSSQACIIEVGVDYEYR